jgi:2,4-dienoyl-CoA reductase-like NADH-dependent reductase (Old Yellow Enzyme family)
MCQYSANEGNATDWHLMHLGQFAVSGVGLIFTEAVGVEMTGRISPGCLALCTDEHEQNLKRVVDFCHDFGMQRWGFKLLMPVGKVQLNSLGWEENQYLLTNLEVGKLMDHLQKPTPQQIGRHLKRLMKLDFLESNLHSWILQSVQIG